MPTMLFNRSQVLTYTPPNRPAPRSSTPRHQNPQTQSVFLTRLPAEIKNEIYTLVFATWSYLPTRLSASKRPPHALSLLLTCRQIHISASLLAFTTYTFPLRTSLQPTYLALRSTTKHLSEPQIHAIRSLSVLSSADTISLLSNALPLFPNLSQFTIYTLRNRNRLQSCGHIAPPRLRSSRPNHAFTNYSESGELSLRAIDTYAPPWFVHVLESVVAGKAFRWQKGERWEARWLQLDSDMCYSRVQWEGEGACEELWMDGDAVGAVEGVGMCGCGGVSWTGAVLVQEGGRSVEVEVAFYGDNMLPEKREYEPKVKLVPGTAPADESVVAQAGIRYEADEEYWEAMRRRNGNLGALCRGLWKSAVAWPTAALIENGSAEQASSLATM